MYLLYFWDRYGIFIMAMPTVLRRQGSALSLRRNYGSMISILRMYNFWYTKTALARLFLRYPRRWILIVWSYGIASISLPVSSVAFIAYPSVSQFVQGSVSGNRNRIASIGCPVQFIAWIAVPSRSCAVQGGIGRSRDGCRNIPERERYTQGECKEQTAQHKFLPCFVHRFFS